MFITKNADYSLRTLMLLALNPPEELMSVEDISNTLSVSKAHMMKVVNQLATLELVETIRGRSGGVRLLHDKSEINIGTAFRQLDEISNIVDCESDPCVFNGVCKLRKIFDQATDAFLEELDKYTLADLVKKRSHLQKIVFRNNVA